MSILIFLLLILQSDLSSDVIDRFAKEHHDHTCKAGKGTSVVWSDIPPAPPLEPKEDHPAILYWTREDFDREEKKREAQAGATNGDAPTDNLVPPPKVNHSKHYYLQHHDGTPVSKKQVAALSFDARGLWETLKAEGRAPKTFRKLSSSAWEFFSRMLLSDPNHAFLRWCDNGEWKLHEWATQSYSSWALNAKLRTQKKKGPKTKTIKSDDVLDDPNLIHMQDEDGGGAKDEENDDVDDNDLSKNDDKHDQVLGDSTQEAPADKGKSTDKGNTPPQVQQVRQSLNHPPRTA